MDVLPVIPPEIKSYGAARRADGLPPATKNDHIPAASSTATTGSKIKRLGAPDIIIRNESACFKEAVDALIDNGRRGKGR